MSEMAMPLPPSARLLRKQKDLSAVYRIKDDPAAAFYGLGTMTGIRQAADTATLAPLHPVGPTLTLQVPKTRCSLAKGLPAGKIDPRTRWQQGV